MWAGKRAFLRKLQRIIDNFVWGGRSRVTKFTVALPKDEGGLGLLGVEAQYDALTNNLMMWTIGPGDHPLRTILQGHICKVSLRRWGCPDLSWIVSSCGKMQMGGSAPWRNICNAWSSLKKHLKPKRPANLEERRDLPLWPPHMNHINEREVKCSTIAKKALQAHGLVSMGDVLQPDGSFITWGEATQRGVPLASEGAFHALLGNLKPVPEIDQPDAQHELFVEASDGPDKNKVWLDLSSSGCSFL